MTRRVPAHARPCMCATASTGSLIMLVPGCESPALVRSQRLALSVNIRPQVQGGRNSDCALRCSGQQKGAAWCAHGEGRHTPMCPSGRKPRMTRAKSPGRPTSRPHNSHTRARTHARTAGRGELYLLTHANTRTGTHTRTGPQTHTRTPAHGDIRSDRRSVKRECREAAARRGPVPRVRAAPRCASSLGCGRRSPPGAAQRTANTCGHESQTETRSDGQPNTHTDTHTHTHTHAHARTHTHTHTPTPTPTPTLTHTRTRTRTHTHTNTHTTETGARQRKGGRGAL